MKPLHFALMFGRTETAEVIRGHMENKPSQQSTGRFFPALAVFTGRIRSLFKRT